MLALGNAYDLIPLVIPIDLDTSQGGDQFSLRDCGGVDLVFITGVGAAGRDLTFTITKHVDLADTVGTTIDLTGLAHPYYYYKQGAAATVVGVGTWTKSAAHTDTDGATVVLDAAEGETSSLIVIPIEATDLGDGYSSLSVSAVVAGGSGAKLGAAIAILRDLHVQRTPGNLRTQLA
jgi:hypothetical protein